MSHDSQPVGDRKRRRPATHGQESIDRLPPHSIDCERAVLGCILLDPNESLPRCVELFNPSSSEAFYDLRHQTLYEMLVSMWDSREPLDLVTVVERLRERDLLELSGGLSYIMGLPEATPTAINLDYYAVQVQDKYLMRRMIRTYTEIVGKIFGYAGKVEELMDQAEKAVLEINQIKAANGLIDIKTLTARALTSMEESWTSGGKPNGIATGYPDLDRLTYGLHPGEMVVIAARPSMGKTSLAMNIAENVAVDDKLPVCVFSMEMTSESLVSRLLCSRSRINIRNVRDGLLSEEDMFKLKRAADDLMSSKLFIDDTAGLSILQLRARARRYWQKHGVKLFVVDYLQLMHSDSDRARDNRTQEVSEISSGLKALAKELQVPIIVLSQLNRELEKTARRPRLSDLRESGAIEQDADVVGLLYRPTDEENASVAVPVNLLLAKQRNGPTGDVPFTFMRDYTRFESMAKIGDTDIPPTNQEANTQQTWMDVTSGATSNDAE